MLVYRWSEELSYANETVQEYYFLSERFKKFGEFASNDCMKFDFDFEVLNTRLNSRIEQNSKHGVKGWGLRIRMRFAFREFQTQCVGCGNTRLSMDYSNCSVCEEFKNNLITRL